MWIIETDGVLAPLRGGRNSEVKVGVIYELANRVEVSLERWLLLQKQRCEARGGLAEFRRRLWAMLMRIGVREADRLIVIGDGAEWIDQTVEMMFYGATRILDFYHMAERIWAVAAARFGGGERRAEQRAHAKLSLVKAGEIDPVLHALSQLKLEAAEAEALRAEAVNDIGNHREGMIYDEYKDENLPLENGAIEGSRKYLVTARCKQGCGGAKVG